MLLSGGPCPPLPTQDLISWIFDSPQYDKSKPVYVDAADGSHSLNYNQTRKLVRQIVAGFHKLDLPKGSCILVNSFNSIYYPVLFLGIVAAGHIFAGANPAYTSYELEHHLKVVSANYVLAEEELLEKSQKAAAAVGIPDSNILLFHPLNESAPKKVPAGTQAWSSVLLTQGERDWERFDDVELQKSRTVARLTSSGTTGLPKACPWTHLNCIAEHELVAPMVWPESKTWDTSFVFATPMFHAATVPRCHISTIRSGVVAYIMRRFDLEGYLAAISNFGVTELFCVPPMSVAIAMSPLTNTKYSLRSLRHAHSGAASLSTQIQDLLLKHMAPDARFTQVYGMTESSCVVTCVQWPEDDRTGSVGQLVPGMEAKLIDLEGNDVTGFDVEGEICLRGPLVMSGYIGIGSEKANAETFLKDGFMRTGDIVLVRKTGEGPKDYRIFHMDRSKELIKVRAFQVSPSEIEATLFQMDGLVDVAVIGIKADNDVDGEWPRAYVVRRPGHKPELTEHDVQKYVDERLAGFKKLRGGVKFVDSIPKNPSGKILKRVLRDEAKKEIKTKL